MGLDTPAAISQCGKEGHRCSSLPKQTRNVLKPDDERTRQEAKFGGVHEWGVGSCASQAVDDIVKVAVLTEECGEVARAVLDQLDDSELLAELVQTAAVCTAWIESLL